MASYREELRSVGRGAGIIHLSLAADGEARGRDRAGTATSWRSRSGCSPTRTGSPGSRRAARSSPRRRLAVLGHREARPATVRSGPTSGHRHGDEQQSGGRGSRHQAALTAIVLGRGSLILGGYVGGVAGTASVAAWLPAKGSTSASWAAPPAVSRPLAPSAGAYDIRVVLITRCTRTPRLTWPTSCRRRRRSPSFPRSSGIEQGPVRAPSARRVGDTGD
jgi:hypothetical protein